MSFTQPTVSLYDILEALSSQQDRSSARRRPHHNNYARPRTRGAYGSPYVQSPYYYAERPQTTYYRPRYYDEDAYDSPYVVGGRGGYGQQPDVLPAILRAFMAQQPAEENEQEEAESPDQLEQDQEPVQVPQIAAQPLAQALADKVLAQAEAESAEENGAEAVDEASDAEQKQAPRSGASSPIPEPLQVSKPQVRMDMPFSPEVNVYDTPEAYVVVLALPGANSKSFKIDYHPSSHELLIKGSLDKKIDVNDKYLRISELKGGKFERSVKFPVVPRIKDEEIKATYANGLLHIKTPKILDDNSQHQPRRRIVIEDVPDEELVFEENPNPPTSA
ncbi:LAQU0S04e08174g1_1 [Lachancea quebecensis]|uniref:LAQU0S04e08174g1_1 n=1 Tax=Lachancea quebecensis TaxID=1654605 RepID=A0A0P1KQU9_9SACH|nr:LAQU0S04e08174g1_1 [Lachancea quebecensis]